MQQVAKVRFSNDLLYVTSTNIQEAKRINNIYSKAVAFCFLLALNTHVIVYILTHLHTAFMYLFNLMASKVLHTNKNNINSHMDNP